MNKEIMGLIDELGKRDCNNATIKLCTVTEGGFIQHNGITIVNCCSADLTFITTYVNKNNKLFMNLVNNGIQIITP